MYRQQLSLLHLVEWNYYMLVAEIRPFLMEEKIQTD